MIPQEEIDILMGMEEKEAEMANRYDPVGRTEGMANSVCDNLRNAYERGYKDGQNDEMESNNALANGFALAQKEKGRDEGRREAWEAAKKIAFTEKNGGLPNEVLRDIFDCSYLSDVCQKYTVDEVIEKITAYEKQKEDEIKVGDEVINGGVIGIVTFVENKKDGGICYHTVRADGYVWYLDDKVTKRTGRHFDQIAEVLKQMSNSTTE